MVGFHYYDLIILAFGFASVVLPVIIGFFWVRSDADQRGQPGLLWAFLTIPGGWITLVVYLAVRTIVSSRPAA